MVESGDGVDHYLASHPPARRRPRSGPGAAEQYRGLEEANRRADEAGLRQIQYERESELEFGTMFINGEDYVDHSQRVTSWIVDGLLPTGYLAILGATSKAGKTCFATALAMSIATGRPSNQHFSGPVRPVSSVNTAVIRSGCPSPCSSPAWARYAGSLCAVEPDD